LEEKRIPALLLNILCTQVDETMGRRSLIMLLRQTRLTEYIDNIPPMDDNPGITVGEYSELLASIYDTLGARGARPIFLHSGRLSAAELRKQRPAQFAVSGMALKLLPTAKRMQIVLDRLAQQGEEMYGVTYRVEETSDAFFLDINDCPYCAAISQRRRAQNKPIAKPVCHIPAAMIDEMVEWATDQKRLVEEVACIAMGDRACTFRIGK
jgi:predicted hydrocarbon binding protein